MKMAQRKITAILLSLTMLAGFGGCSANNPRNEISADNPYGDTGFELVATKNTVDFGETFYHFRHVKTGAELVWLNNDSEQRAFSIGFKTPPADSKGANHVLEHSLLCGSEKYPSVKLMPYVRETALADVINAVTSGDYTYYEIKTPNETEYYNLIDVYMNGLFHPLLLSDENIFKQQGIRLEDVDGQIEYNGVVYNELRMNSYDSSESAVNYTSDILYHSIYGDTTPAYNSGGSVDDVKTLTYEDVLNVYNTYYKPTNSVTCLSGKQDIVRTLTVLDSFFCAYEKQSINVSFADTKRIPEDKISEHGLTKDTNTVDIGFMSSGVPMSESAAELYARDIIFQLLLAKMGEYHTDSYLSWGSTGGISNLALIVSQVPISRKDEIISEYDDILNRLAKDGFISIDTEIDNYFETWQNDNALRVLDGSIYHNDPLFYADTEQIKSKLKTQPEIFAEVLNKYFIENPYSAIAVTGNGHEIFEEAPLAFSADEVEKIHKETAAFQAWADAPDDPTVMARIPSLGLDEVKTEPDYSKPICETVGNLDFYYTQKQNAESAALNLFFPIQTDTVDSLNYLQLVSSFISSRATAAELDSVFFDVSPMENYHDATKVNLYFSVLINGTDDTITDEFQKIMAFLNSKSTWDADAFNEYMLNTPAQILTAYTDPYNLSYDLMQSSQSAVNSFRAFTSGSTEEGSVFFYHFLKKAKPEDYPAMLTKIRGMCFDMILNGAPTTEYIGDDGYTFVKQAVCDRFQKADKREAAQAVLPAGIKSGAIITHLEDSTHFMLSGNIMGSGYVYSGKMDVLAKVLTSNYIRPQMRGKYGAYDASIHFDRTGMTCSVAGFSNIDLAIEVWSGMGDYLRSIKLTQKELDAVIVPTVMKYDEKHYFADYGAQLALCNKTSEDIDRVRNEMLSTTVEDLCGFADFVDSMVGQNRVFAVLGKTAADSARFEFDCYVDAANLEISPKQ